VIESSIIVLLIIDNKTLQNLYFFFGLRNDDIGWTIMHSLEKGAKNKEKIIKSSSFFKNEID